MGKTRSKTQAQGRGEHQAGGGLRVSRIDRLERASRKDGIQG